ncbi:unnamed protein product [Nippostrongylus brasiliensis]|uniref:Uncharacterized protein n=1 Tax=Nippostrongylus brasiliensis TaxID=27835 RepID=A0A0N4YA07_NIPBR|nr:unnamed protein product [Nippostrongylus brasiliensis]
MQGRVERIPSDRWTERFVEPPLAGQAEDPSHSPHHDPSRQFDALAGQIAPFSYDPDADLTSSHDTAVTKMYSTLTPPSSTSPHVFAFFCTG